MSVTNAATDRHWAQRGRQDVGPFDFFIVDKNHRKLGATHTRLCDATASASLAPLWRSRSCGLETAAVTVEMGVTWNGSR